MKLFLLVSLLFLAGCKNVLGPGEEPQFRFWCTDKDGKITVDVDYTSGFGYLDSPSFEVEGKTTVWRVGRSRYIQSAGELCQYKETGRVKQ